MSIIAFPALSTSEMTTGPDASLPRTRVRTIRRRATLEQGRALEALGHAVEYLVDSRMFQMGEHNRRDEQEAVQILMRMSRAVFVECPEAVSLRRRVGRWVADRLGGAGAMRERG